VQTLVCQLEFVPEGLFERKIKLKATCCPLYPLKIKVNINERE